jgi:Pyruvate/2-oxoacid:ferredoxin oxidoreductase delta subunit
MHHDITRKLWEAFPPDKKHDFWAGYLYLKYTQHFFNKAIEGAGMKPMDLPPLDPAIEEMLHAVAWQVAEAAGSAETSLYHGKIMRVQDARQLVTQKEDVRLTPPERVVPFKIARDIVLEGPESIAVGRCPCRSASEKPCLPENEQDVCLFLGEPWVTFMDQNNATYHRISQDEAVRILEKCHEKGFVHTAYFEHAAGNRLDAICNCCSCCCMGVRMWNQFEGQLPLLAPSGYVAEVTDECNGCEECAHGKCNFFAIKMSADGVTAIIDEAKCMGCGVCEAACPIDAIHLRREPSKGDPLDLAVLKAQG